MGLDVKVEVNRPNGTQPFSNGDTISGVVKLNITKSLDLTSILVKLEGVSSTAFQVPTHPEKRGKDRKEVLRSDVHKFLYDSLVVFPPQNVRSVSDSKEFTLTPGSYAYDFSFKLPLNSSCKDLTGISNKIVFNNNTFDVVVNNGSLKYNAQDYLRGLAGIDGHRSNMAQQQYHVSHPLPPTFQEKTMASVKYFVKVTCNRPSLFKINLRNSEPFSFVPTALDDSGALLTDVLARSEYREVFYRRSVSLVKSVVSNVKTLPTPPKRKGLLGSILGSGSSRSGRPSFSSKKQELQFAFEMRLRNPPLLSPLTESGIRLFLVLDKSPAQFMSSTGKGQASNGQGVIYLQHLLFELQAVTVMSVIENTNSQVHQAQATQTIPIYENTFENIPLDLSNAKPQTFASATSSEFVGTQSYELEIPRQYYSDWALSRAIPATFQTCNIKRSYALRVVAGLTCEKIDETSHSTRNSMINSVDVVCPEIRVLSGARPSNALPHEAHTQPPPAKQGGDYPPEKQTYTEPPGSAAPGEGSSSALPTYEDATNHN